MNNNKTKTMLYLVQWLRTLVTLPAMLLLGITTLALDLYGLLLATIVGDKETCDDICEARSFNVIRLPRIKK